MSTARPIGESVRGAAHRRRPEVDTMRRYGGSISVDVFCVHRSRVALTQSRRVAAGAWRSGTATVSSCHVRRTPARSGSLDQSPTTRDTGQARHPLAYTRRGLENDRWDAPERRHLDRGSKRWSTRLSMAGDRFGLRACAPRTSRVTPAGRGVAGRAPRGGEEGCPVDRRCSRSQLGRGVAGRARTAGARPDPVDRPCSRS